MRAILHADRIRVSSVSPAKPSIRTGRQWLNTRPCAAGSGSTTSRLNTSSGRSRLAAISSSANGCAPMVQTTCLADLCASSRAGTPLRENFGAQRLFCLHHLGVERENYYLIDVFRRRLNYPDLKRAIVPHAEMFDADKIVIEGKSSGTQLIQDLQNDGVWKVVEYKPPPGADKIMRLHACSDRFEAAVWSCRATPHG